MKKQVMICLCLCLMTSSVSLAAKSKLTASPESVVVAYIDAFKNSDAEILKEIMHDDAYVTMSRQNQVIKHSKKQLIQFYKKENDNTLNCDTFYEIVSCCEAVAVVQVDFKFENFVQRNYITVEKNKENEWKVMGISKFFT